MKTKIVITGGGFAGLSAAMYFEKALARRSDIEVTLISHENFILFTPMLHEVAAGDLYPGDVVNPLRRILRRVRFVQAEVEEIDLNARVVRCAAGLGITEMSFQFDHLLLALGSETNFFNMPDVSDWAVTIKNLSDAALLRNRAVAFLEQASLKTDEDARRYFLTFVTAGGGFSGTETTGALNDFVRDAVRYYPGLSEDMIRVVIVHPGKFLLPELGEELGNYAELKLRQRKVEVIKGVRVAGYDGKTLKLSDGASIPTATLLWTAGVKPCAVIERLPSPKEHGRILVNEFLSVPGVAGLWAAGDTAAVPNGGVGKFYPPTAQHGLREGRVVAKNIEASIAGAPLKPFIYKSQGQLATVGRRTGVAMIYGWKFSGFFAWWMWRTIYWVKLPRLAKKMRVLADWTLDLFFGREIEQLITARTLEEEAQRFERVRARLKE